MSDPRLDAIRGNAIRGIQRRADDVRDRSYAAAEWCDVRFLLAELERVTAALREAREGFVEAYEYGCQWPIGLDTDPQEQRGMDRDVFLRNCEFLIERIDAALTDVARAAREDK
jgi:hypothetical protein